MKQPEFGGQSHDWLVAGRGKKMSLRSGEEYGL